MAVFYNYNTSKQQLMAAMLLLLGLFISPMLKSTGAQSVGVCYGRNGNNLPLAQDVINLYNSNSIRRMRVYDPNSDVLNALRGSNIEIILDVPNPDLQSVASDPSAATAWVQNNVQSYIPDVRFRYIAVGNEVDPDKGTAQYVSFVLPAMQNIHNAIVAAGLQSQIRVSTATYTGLLGQSSPPSTGVFRDDTRSTFIDPIIGFLEQNNLPLLVNVYPYFAEPERNLPYALFTAPGVVVTDSNNGLEYRNLFDAILDAHYSALEKSGGPNVEIVVSESGWPSEGGPVASADNARTYYRNLIGHVTGTNGTPKRTGRAIETYLFGMFDENLKDGLESEKHFGIFTPDQQSKYQLNFS